MRKKLVLLKIGGSVITDKKNNNKKIKKQNLKRIADEIFQEWKKEGFSLVIVHGVGSFGHILAKKFDLKGGYKNPEQIRALSDIYSDLAELNGIVIEYLRRNGIPATLFKISSSWLLNNRELKNGNVNLIERMLDLGIVPVLHGDVLLDEKLKFSILSGDYIIYHLAKSLKADRVILGTDTDGVFDCDPVLNKNSKLLKEINTEIIKGISLGESRSIDVTGGMKGKINELLKLAELGIGSEIINIAQKGILEKALEGNKDMGTVIRAKIR